MTIYVYLFCHFKVEKTKQDIYESKKEMFSHLYMLYIDPKKKQTCFQININAFQPLHVPPLCVCNQI